MPRIIMALVTQMPRPTINKSGKPEPNQTEQNGGAYEGGRRRLGEECGLTGGAELPYPR